MTEYNPLLQAFDGADKVQNRLRFEQWYWEHHQEATEPQEPIPARRDGFKDLIQRRIDAPPPTSPLVAHGDFQEPGWE